MSEAMHISGELRGKLLRTASRFVGGGAEEAEDIVQETLLTLWKISRKGYVIHNMAALAQRITMNICIDRRRRRKLLTETLTGDLYPGGEQAETATDKSDIEDLRRRLYGILSDTQRKYMTMRAYMGLSLDEIARLTGRPKTSIKTAISSARRQMLEALKKEL